MAYGFILPSLPLRGKLHARFIHNQPTVEVHARRLDPFMSTERKARRPKGLRGMTSIATTVGAILALCPSKSEALTPPSLSPFGIEMQHTHISGIDGIHANRNLQLMRVVSKNTTKNATIPASTGAIETTGHTSIGQKLATVLRSRGFTKELVVLFLSALPVVELRGGIPVGFLLGLPPFHTFLLSVTGNMLPVVPILWLLRRQFVQRLAATYLDRARRKAQSVSNSTSQARALALFVGVPLPGTGAWTGCLVGFVLGMSFHTTFLALLVGVIAAAIIVSSLCFLGRTGGIIAAAVIVGFGVVSIFKSTGRGINITGESRAEVDGVERCE